METPKPCECEICRRTREYDRFSALLPESERESFRDWYSAMFDELEEMTTDSEFPAFSKPEIKQAVGRIASIQTRPPIVLEGDEYRS